MKKVRKIYGVSGMMEYHAIIQMGTKSQLRVNFTEGSCTAMGVTPATYSTDNLMFQHAIEHSTDFKSGRIKLIKTLPLDGEVEIAHNQPAVGVDVMAAENTEPAFVAAKAGENATEGESAEAELVKKVFACKDDAKDFFEEAFGMKRGCVALRTKDDIVATGKAKGIEVVFND